MNYSNLSLIVTMVTYFAENTSMQLTLSSLLDKTHTLVKGKGMKHGKGMLSRKLKHVVKPQKYI